MSETVVNNYISLDTYVYNWFLGNYCGDLDNILYVDNVLLSDVLPR